MKRIIAIVAALTSAQAMAAGASGAAGAGSGGPISDDAVVMKWRGSMDTPIGHVQQAVKALVQLRADARAGKVSMREQDVRLARIKAVFDRYGYVMPDDYADLRQETLSERQVASDDSSRVRVVPVGRPVR